MVPAPVHHIRRVLVPVVWLFFPRSYGRLTRRSTIPMDSQRHSKSHDVVRHFNPKGGRLSLCFRLFVQSRIFLFPMDLNLDIPDPLTAVPSQLTTNPILLVPSLFRHFPFLFVSPLTSSQRPTDFYNAIVASPVMSRFLLFPHPRLYTTALFMDGKRADKARR